MPLARLGSGLRRAPTPDEQQILAAWSGWGAVPRLFDHSDVAARWAQLHELLTEDERGVLARYGADVPDALHFEDPAADRLWGELIPLIPLLPPDLRTSLLEWSGQGDLPGVFDDRFAEQRAELRRLLTPEQYDAARRSTTNAHYTDAMLAASIWDGLERLGFTGGDVLEPGCGAGHFIGLAPDSAAMTGIEREPVSAAIAAALYPDAHVVARSFADIDAAEGAFDAAVGNVPFAKVTLHDPKHNPGRHSIHNYFLIKSLRLTRPGGLVAVLTSRYTMDARNPAARRELAELADLVGAVRLPTGAHRRAAGTEVVTDLLILRRRHDGAPADTTVAPEAWERSAPILLGGEKNGAEGLVEVNQYYLDHPENVLGEFSLEHGMYNAQNLKVRGNLDTLGVDFAAAVQRIADDAVQRGMGMTPRAASTPRAATTVHVVDPEAAQFEGFLAAQLDGTFTRRDGTTDVPYAPPAAQADELRALLGVRDVAMALVRAEQACVDDTAEIAELRAELNRVYDAYVANPSYGPINRFTERPQMRQVWHVFGDWCDRHGVDKTPATPITLRSYLSELRAAGLGQDQLQRHLKAIVKAHGTAFDKAMSKAAKIVARNVAYLKGVDDPTEIAAIETALFRTDKPASLLSQADIEDPRLPTAAIAAGLAAISAAAPVTDADFDYDSLDMRRAVIVRPPQGGFRDDPFANVARALEKFDPTTQTARKADIFAHRVINPPRTRLGAETAEEALSICLDKRSRIDLGEIAWLMGLLGEQEARAALDGLVFDDPATDEVVWAPFYLAGNVRQKLAAARLAAEADAKYEVNVAALEPIIPADKGPEEIEVRLGSWIGPEYVQQFLHELLGGAKYRQEIGVAASDPFVRVESVAGMWLVSPDSGRQTEAIRLNANEIWSGGGLDAYDLTERLLIGAPIRVMKTVEYVDSSGEIREREVLDPEATEDAVDKASEISDRFADWVWENTSRAQEVMRRYNDSFNAEIPVDYGAIDLSLPGLSAAFSAEGAKPLREHQKIAIARVIYQGGTGLVHEVGAGKTLEMIIGVMERRRRGLASKPVIVVPNDSIAEQFEREWMQAYPGARLLTGTSADLAEKKKGRNRRAEFVARVATGDWDAVIMTKESFQSIPLPAEIQERFLQAELDDLRAEKEAHVAVMSESMTKRIETAMENAEERLEKRMADIPRDTKGISFVEAGFDFVVPDEAQNYKNGLVISAIDDLVIPGSNRAIDLDMKLAYLQETHGSARVVLATATPWTGKYSEVYLWQKRLGHEMPRFDTWARTYVIPQQYLEMTPGGKLRPKTRTRAPINEPELWTSLRLTSDIRMKQDLNLKVPALRNGSIEIIEVPASEQARIFTLDLARRERQLKGQPEKGEDNHLVIAHDGQLAATDLRTVGITTDEPQKVDIVAGDIFAEWSRAKDNIYSRDDGTEHPVRGGCILVFCDESTPSRHWNFYAELRAQLVVRGMDEKSIRFIHEAASPQRKADLLAAAREGAVSVLVGSTMKMGAGINVQDRVLGGYEITGQWRPDIPAQAIGRAERQGNQNDEYFWKRVVLAPSMDAKKWEITAQKQAMFAPLYSSTPPERSREIVNEEGDSLADAMAAATGDPRYKEKAQLDVELKTLNRQRSGHGRGQQALKLSRTRSIERIPRLEARAARQDELAAGLVSVDGENFAMQVAGTRHTKRADAAQAMRDRLTSLAASAPRAREGTTVPLGMIGGLSVSVTCYPLRDARDRFSITFPEASESTVGFHLAADLPGGIGLVTRLQNQLQVIGRAGENTREQIRQEHEKIAAAEAAIGNPFSGDQRLVEVVARRTELIAQLSPEDAERDPNEDPNSPEAIARREHEEARRLEDEAMVEAARELAVLSGCNTETAGAFAWWYREITGPVTPEQRPGLEAALEVWFSIGQPGASGRTRLTPLGAEAVATRARQADAGMDTVDAAAERRSVAVVALPTPTDPSQTAVSSASDTTSGRSTPPPKEPPVPGRGGGGDGSHSGRPDGENDEPPETPTRRAGELAGQTVLDSLETIDVSEQWSTLQTELAAAGWRHRHHADVGLGGVDLHRQIVLTEVGDDDADELQVLATHVEDLREALNGPRATELIDTILDSDIAQNPAAGNELARLIARCGLRGSAVRWAMAWAQEAVAWRGIAAAAASPGLQLLAPNGDVMSTDAALDIWTDYNRGPIVCDDLSIEIHDGVHGLEAQLTPSSGQQRSAWVRLPSSTGPDGDRALQALTAAIAGAGSRAEQLRAQLVRELARTLLLPQAQQPTPDATEMAGPWHEAEEALRLSPAGAERERGQLLLQTARVYEGIARAASAGPTALLRPGPPVVRVRPDDVAAALREMAHAALFDQRTESARWWGVRIEFGHVDGVFAALVSCHDETAYRGLGPQAAVTSTPDDPFVVVEIEQEWVTEGSLEHRILEALTVAVDTAGEQAQLLLRDAAALAAVNDATLPSLPPLGSADDPSIEHTIPPTEAIAAFALRESLTDPEHRWLFHELLVMSQQALVRVVHRHTPDNLPPTLAQVVRRRMATPLRAVSGKETSSAPDPTTVGVARRFADEPGFATRLHEASLSWIRSRLDEQRTLDLPGRVERLFTDLEIDHSAEDSAWICAWIEAAGLDEQVLLWARANSEDQFADAVDRYLVNAGIDRATADRGHFIVSDTIVTLLGDTNVFAGQRLRDLARAWLYDTRGRTAQPETSPDRDGVTTVVEEPAALRPPTPVAEPAPTTPTDAEADTAQGDSESTPDATTTGEPISAPQPDQHEISPIAITVWPSLRLVRSMVEQFDLAVRVVRVGERVFVAVHEPTVPNPPVLCLPWDGPQAFDGAGRTVAAEHFLDYLADYRAAVDPALFTEHTGLRDWPRRLAQITPYLLAGPTHLPDLAAHLQTALHLAAEGNRETAEDSLRSAEHAAGPLRLTPDRHAQVVRAIEDYAAQWAFTGDIGRYLTDAAYLDGSAREWDWVNDYIASHGEVLAPQSQRDAIIGQRNHDEAALAQERSGRFNKAARAAYNAGEYERALDMLDQAELANPADVAMWEQARQTIATTMNAAAQPPTAPVIAAPSSDQIQTTSPGARADDIALPARGTAVVEPSPPTLDSADANDYRLALHADLNGAAAAWFDTQLDQSRRAQTYLRDRLGGQDAVDRIRLRDGADIGGLTIGYAPSEWTGLVDHLRARGYRDQDMVDSGVATVIGSGPRRGQLIDRFRNRILFAVRDQRGRIAGFSGRAVNPRENEPKYLNTHGDAPLYRKGELLLGLWEQRDIAGHADAVIVEGGFDVAATMAANLTDPRRPLMVLAPCGTALTSQQLDALDAAVDPAHRHVFALDPDVGGVKATRRVGEAALTRYPSFDIAVLQDGLDPAEWALAAGPAQTLAAYQPGPSCRPALEVLADARMDDSAEGLDHGWVEAQLQAARDVAALLATLGTDRRADVADAGIRAATQLHISPVRMAEMIAQAAADRGTLPTTPPVMHHDPGTADTATDAPASLVERTPTDSDISDVDGAGDESSVGEDDYLAEHGLAVVPGVTDDSLLLDLGWRRTDSESDNELGRQEVWSRDGWWLAVLWTDDGRLVGQLFLQTTQWVLDDNSNPVEGYTPWEAMEATVTTAAEFREILAEAGRHGWVEPAPHAGQWCLTGTPTAAIARAGTAAGSTYREVFLRDGREWLFADSGQPVPLTPRMPRLVLPDRAAVERYVAGSHHRDRDIRALVGSVLSGRARGGVSPAEARARVADFDEEVHRRLTIAARAGQGPGGRSPFDPAAAEAALQQLLNEGPQAVDGSDADTGTTVPLDFDAESVPSRAPQPLAGSEPIPGTETADAAPSELPTFGDLPVAPDTANLASGTAFQLWLTDTLRSLPPDVDGIPTAPLHLALAVVNSVLISGTRFGAEDFARRIAVNAGLPAPTAARLRQLADHVDRAFGDVDAQRAALGSFGDDATLADHLRAISAGIEDLAGDPISLARARTDDMFRTVHPAAVLAAREAALNGDADPIAGLFGGSLPAALRARFLDPAALDVLRDAFTVLMTNGSWDAERRGQDVIDAGHGATTAITLQALAAATRGRARRRDAGGIALRESGAATLADRLDGFAAVLAQLGDFTLPDPPATDRWRSEAVTETNPLGTDVGRAVAESGGHQDQLADDLDEGEPLLPTDIAVVLRRMSGSEFASFVLAPDDVADPTIFRGPSGVPPVRGPHEPDPGAFEYVDHRTRGIEIHIDGLNRREFVSWQRLANWIGAGLTPTSHDLLRETLTILTRLRAAEPGYWQIGERQLAQAAMAELEIYLGEAMGPIIDAALVAQQQGTARVRRRRSAAGEQRERAGLLGLDDMPGPQREVLDRVAAIASALSDPARRTIPASQVEVGAIVQHPDTAAYLELTQIAAVDDGELRLTGVLYGRPTDQLGPTVWTLPVADADPALAVVLRPSSLVEVMEQAPGRVRRADARAGIAVPADVDPKRHGWSRAPAPPSRFEDAERWHRAGSALVLVWRIVGEQRRLITATVDGRPHPIATVDDLRIMLIDAGQHGVAHQDPTGWQVTTYPTEATATAAANQNDSLRLTILDAELGWLFADTGRTVHAADLALPDPARVSSDAATDQFSLFDDAVVDPPARANFAESVPAAEPAPAPVDPSTEPAAVLPGAADSPAGDAAEPTDTTALNPQLATLEPPTPDMNWAELEQLARHVGLVVVKTKSAQQVHTDLDLRTIAVPWDKPGATSEQLLREELTRLATTPASSLRTATAPLPANQLEPPTHISAPTVADAIDWTEPVPKPGDRPLSPAVAERIAAGLSRIAESAETDVALSPAVLGDADTDDLELRGLGEPYEDDLDAATRADLIAARYADLVDADTAAEAELADDASAAPTTQPIAVDCQPPHRDSPRPESAAARSAQPDVFNVVADEEDLDLGLRGSGEPDEGDLDAAARADLIAARYADLADADTAIEYPAAEHAATTAAQPDGPVDQPALPLHAASVGNPGGALVSATPATPESTPAASAPAASATPPKRLRPPVQSPLDPSRYPDMIGAASPSPTGATPPQAPRRDGEATDASAQAEPERSVSPPSPDTVSANWLAPSVGVLHLTDPLTAAGPDPVARSSSPKQGSASTVETDDHAFGKEWTRLVACAADLGFAVRTRYQGASGVDRDGAGHPVIWVAAGQNALGRVVDLAVTLVDVALHQTRVRRVEVPELPEHQSGEWAPFLGTLPDPGRRQLDPERFGGTLDLPISRPEPDPEPAPVLALSATVAGTDHTVTGLHIFDQLMREMGVRLESAPRPLAAVGGNVAPQRLAVAASTAISTTRRASGGGSPGTGGHRSSAGSSTAGLGHLGRRHGPTPPTFLARPSTDPTGRNRR